MKINYIEQQCKSVLHKISKSNLPFKWGVNPFRGCLHSCIYCFARYTHSYLDLDPSKDFETTIIVKMNSPQILRKELSKPKWKKEFVILGSVCDPYQPAEKKYQLTREILKVFRQYRSPLTIATKSDLITRDIDILSEMSQEMFVNIVMSVSSISPKAAKKLEPRAPSTVRRLQAISKLRDAGLKVGILLMPVVPFINDSDGEIESLFEAIANAGANFVIPGILYLQGASKNRFFDFIKEEFPELESKYKQFYSTRSPPKYYRIKKQLLFRTLIKKYQLDDYNTLKPENQSEQLTIEHWLKKEGKGDK